MVYNNNKKGQFNWKIIVYPLLIIIVAIVAVTVWNNYNKPKAKISVTEPAKAAATFFASEDFKSAIQNPETKMSQKNILNCLTNLL